MTRALLPALVLLAACTDRVEPPDLSLDTDGDTLTNGEELARGTDPFEPDSDGDGYLDGHEVFNGTDPLDAGDRIYRGRWPYWHDKDTMRSRQLEGWSPELGGRLPRFTATDHFGETVDLYDFAGPDQPHEYLLIDVCVEWCGPCRSLAEWVAGGDGQAYGLEEAFADVRAAIDGGELAYLTVLTQDSSGDPTDEEDVARYHDDFPHRRVPVLTDSDSLLENAVVGRTGGWPSFLLVRADTMRLVESPGFMIPDGLAATQERL